MLLLITHILPVSIGSMAPYDPDAGLSETDLIVLGSLDTEGIWQEYLDGIDISDDLAWTRDARTMLYINSIAKLVYAFDFNNENGTICKWSVSIYCLIRLLNSVTEIAISP